MKKEQNDIMSKMKAKELQQLLTKKKATWSLNVKLAKEQTVDDLIKQFQLGSERIDSKTLTNPEPIKRTLIKRIEFQENKKNLVGYYKALPKQKDWRKVNGVVSPARNQGGCGSCVAFATAAAIESHYRITHYNTLATAMNLSEASLFFRAQRQCNSKEPRYGWYIPSALAAAATEGLCMEHDYPYRPVNQDAVIPDGDTRIIKIDSYTYTTSRYMMKRWLVEKGPLIANYDVYEDFYPFFHWSNSSEEVYSYKSGKYKGSHAICVIGYDDNKNAWLCKNSWGTNSLRPDGCFWIKYDSCGIDDVMYMPINVYDKYTIDKTSYNPNTLKVLKESDGTWLLTDGNSRMKIFANETDARNALRVARRHTKQCFVGRSNKRKNRRDFIFSYWEGKSGLSQENLTKTDIIRYDPAKVTARYIPEKDYWRIEENGSHYMFIADNMADAMAMLAVVERFTKLCFIGRDNKKPDRKKYIMQYFE